MLFHLCVGLKFSITKDLQYEIEKGGSRRYLSKCGFSSQSTAIANLRKCVICEHQQQRWQRLMTRDRDFAPRFSPLIRQHLRCSSQPVAVWLPGNGSQKSFLGKEKGGKGGREERRGGKVERSCPGESLSLPRGPAQGESWGWGSLVRCQFPTAPAFHGLFLGGSPRCQSLRP